LGWPLFSSDKIRKTLARVPLTERTPQERRNEVYSPQMTQRTYRKLVEDGLGAFNKCGGVILDATFSSRANRKFLQEECNKAHARLQIIEVDVDRATIRDRLRARDKSAGETSDARLEDFEKLTATYQSPSELASDLIKISGSGPVHDTLKSALLRSAEKQVAIVKSTC